ncbi:hypothetical protein C4K88_15405 [Arthrobacter pityocampae]|uniref:Uncharacterized protein n=1 Tax=Arthrobacter pityocampae TaxID=547334 RepID=A0A2S5IUV4_9MICC|nr:hypothetical protein [Arthrobacter pityocampae]PPB48335.1 hypothetical protein C4K88_15405 [Arthrobacter pityocampae]
MTEAKRHPFSDPASPVFGILSTATMGALSLIDGSTLDDRSRRAVHAGTAVITGLYTGVTVGGRHLPLRVLAGLAGGAVALRFADLGDVIEARLEERLRRAGAQHPRRWMAAGAAAVTFAGFLGDRAAARRALVVAVLDDASEQVKPLDPRVRSLVEGILDATDIAGARELRAQLAVAQELSWGDEFTSTVYLEVPADLPRAVPHDQIFPVRAQFTGPGDATYQVVLQLSAGHLDHMAVEPTDQENIDLADGILAEWPDPTEVVHVLDGVDGTKTVSQPTPPSPDTKPTSETR